MAQNKSISTDKADEFGRLYRQPTGWRLAWLVASSCVVGQGRRTDIGTSAEVESQRIGTQEFADLASVGVRTVRYYYRAWELAADAGQVPHADELENSEDWEDLLVDYGLDEFESETAEPEQIWAHWYKKARAGELTQAEQKEQVKKERAKEEASKPKAPKQKPVVEEQGSEDEDEDQEEQTSVASDIALSARNTILEVKESIEFQVNKIRSASNTYGDEAMNSEDVLLALKQLAEVIQELMKEVAAE